MAVLTLMTSCLTDSDTEVIRYDDAAITSFSLGSLSRTVHTKSKSGADSTYVTTVTGSMYAFSIDQTKGLIYNVDSLPNGTNIKKCLVNIATRNGGVALIQSLTSDSLSAITSTDSLDFSKPRVIKVYSNDGSWNKSYTVDIRVHSEDANKLYWTKKNDCAQIAQLEGIKAFCLAGNLFVCGMNNGAVKMFTSKVTDGNAWNELAVPFASMPTFATTAQTVYAVADGKVYKSADAATWSVTSESSEFKSMLAASRSEVYALSTSGQILRSDLNASAWTVDALDADAAYLPQSGISGFCVPSLVNSDIDKVTIIGNRDNASDATPMIWTKVVDNSSPENSQSWMFQPFDNTTWHHAPKFANLSAIPYGKGLLMLGSVSADGGTAVSNYGFYYSWDDALNWWKDPRFSLPENFRSNPMSFAMVADGNTGFWIIGGTYGEVWRGHFSSWTWE